MIFQNQTVLMTGPDFLDDKYAINARINPHVQINRERAKLDHQNIANALSQAEIEVIRLTPPENCQDGVYTANWALCVGNKAVLARLPNIRKQEERYAVAALKGLGKEVIPVPGDFRFGGQGDALVCGDYLFVGSHYNTDLEVHNFLAETFGLKPIGLQTIPLEDKSGRPLINRLTNWPDSYFYNLDLALGVINHDLIVWCPEAFTEASRSKIHRLEDIEKIEVSYDEALNGMACNLISTGRTVIMSGEAPTLASQLKKRGLKVVTPDIEELQKGGGIIRSAALTI